MAALSRPHPEDEWRARAEDAIPGGSSTGSKQPGLLYGSQSFDDQLPTHYERASGCTIFATDGRKLIDCGMALGAVAIGYADPAVTKAVQNAAAFGNVTALPHRLEVEVAERLVEVIPCAEQVRFLRTGAEATAAAVRLARAATGRDHVIASGYFGWLDWCSDAPGVPPSAKSDITHVPFDDVEALHDAVQRCGDDLAAIIVEPLVERIASVRWLHAARELSTASGALLVFDEIKTAFRIRTGGIQALSNIEPDLTTLGKAMANGYPLAAVVGRAAVMSSASRTWISSTAAAEATGLAAALAVLDWHDRTDVCQRLHDTGTGMQAMARSALLPYPELKISVDGPAAMWRLVAEDSTNLDALVALATRHGVLLKRGAYQFASLAHDRAALDRIGEGLGSAARELSMHLLHQPSAHDD